MIIENKEAISRWKEAKHRLLENPPPTKSGVLQKLSAAASSLGNYSSTRSSQRLLLLKDSPRKALSSVSNILLDPGSHEAQQIVRKSNHPVTSRSSNAILQSSARETNIASNNESAKSNKEMIRILGTGSCKREAKQPNNLLLGSSLSPSDIRHQLFTEVRN